MPEDIDKEMNMAMRTSTLAAALLLAAASAWSQPDGMGRGMMGGHGMGPGMMGGYGMGPGMMDAHGMMGGCGMGPGMMGGWDYGIPDLTNEQRAKIAAAEKEFRQKQWQVMEKMHDLQFQSPDIHRDGKFDEQAARKQYDAMAALRKQMFENSLEERKRIDAILTPQQREQLQRPGPGPRR